MTKKPTHPKSWAFAWARMYGAHELAVYDRSLAIAASASAPRRHPAVSTVMMPAMKNGR